MNTHKNDRFDHSLLSTLTARTPPFNLDKQIIRIAHELKACESTGDPDVKLELITMLKQFLERRRVYQHIEEAIVDCRNKDQIIYSKQSIILSALAIFLFRMGSRNKFKD